MCGRVAQIKGSVNALNLEEGTMTVLERFTGVTDELRGEVREAADESERLRTMPPHLVEATRAAGLFRMAMPAALGGLEVDPITIVESIEAMSRADASAGWTTLIGNSTAFFAWLEPTAAEDLLGGNRDVVSTSMFAPLGQARRDGGDLIINGRWPFNSGCAHADWYQNAVVVMDDGVPGVRADGRPDIRFAMFPRDGASIIDTWDSLGLRGTGSHDIEVHELRIPIEHSAAPMLDEPAGSGPLSRLGFFPLLTILMGGFPLGVARRALDELALLAPTKRRGASPLPIAADARAQHDIGVADAALQAARAFLLDALGEAWSTVTSGTAPSSEQTSRIMLAGQQAMDVAVAAVDRAFSLAGASAVYAGHPLQRCFRDIHTANQHIAFTGQAFTAYGQALLTP
jgi:alkylation response protein AidB-like acyl-CoA dehydrogenase